MSVTQVSKVQKVPQHIAENCPESTILERIVWASQNKQVVGIQCSASHSPESRPNSYGFSRKAAKANKNSVFLDETHSIIKRADAKC